MHSRALSPAAARFDLAGAIAAVRSGAAPSSLRSSSHVDGASGDPASILAQIQRAQSAFHDRQDGTLRDIQLHIDGMERRLSAARVPAPGDMGGNLAYTRDFAAWMRKGVPEASLTEGSNSDGGYLAPVEWDRKISQAARNISPLRSLARIVTSSTNAYRTVIYDNATASGWTGETAVRPNTAMGQVATLDFPSGEIYANPAVSQRILDDALFNLEEWLAAELETVFAIQEGAAFVSGDGVNKPSGFLTYVAGGANAGHPMGAVQTLPSGAGAAITGDAFMDMFYSLNATYRPNSTWLMSSATGASLSKLKDGMGNYL